MDDKGTAGRVSQGASGPTVPEPPIMPLPRRVSDLSDVRSPLEGHAFYSQNNIDRLERSAEELSQRGSDIGREIRKMNDADKARSRQNSIQSSHKGEITVVSPRRMGSGRSQTSHANNSVVDVNTNARWGGYSPSGFIQSPTGSVRSYSSWTHASANRAPSGTQSSKLAQMVEPLQEGRPLDSPLTPSSASIYSQQQMSRQASQSSFATRYDQIAGQIEETLQTIPPTPSPHLEQRIGLGVHSVPDRPRSTDTFQEAEIAFEDFDGVHFDPDREEYVELDQEGNEVRRVSARTSSGSMMDVASMLKAPQARPDSFTIPPPRDSMVYYPAPVPRMLNLPKRLSQLPAAHVQAKRRSEMLHDLPAGARQSAPWIPPMALSEDGTRSQGDARSPSGSASSPQQEQPRAFLNERMSVANAHNLPPQLRATLFFEQQSIAHDVEVKSESAVATLDSILQASTNAPVSAFTHHPYAGDVAKAVYASEKPHQRQSTATTLASIGDKEKEKKLKKKRSSSIGNFFRRNSTTLDGELNDEPKSRPASRGSMLDLNDGNNKLRKRKSQMSLGTNSLGDELERADTRSVGIIGEDAAPATRRQSMMSAGRHSMMSGALVDQAVNASPNEERVVSESRPVSMMPKGKTLTDGEQIEEDFREQEAEEDLELEDEDPVFAQPTTLLAELQVRKAQLKSRNRTAATAYPDGMHSTLLQLDAVEQINAKKRQKTRVALAWEDPHQAALASAERDGEDEDVPLGVLFPSKDGLVNRKLGDSRDWNRPLGLMERRELEDNEPLAGRRARLNPGAAPLRSTMNLMSQLDLGGGPEPEEADNEEEEGETLGQRLRRLKTKSVLDEAISGSMAGRDGNARDSTFSTAVLDEFPELKSPTDGKQDEKRDSSGSKKEGQTNAGAEEEETLGQRRARLQREREASGEQAATRPVMRQSQSMANLLSSHPVGQRPGNSSREAAQGTLLHTAGLQQAKSRQDLLATNLRSASHGLDRPLVDARAQSRGNLSGGLLAGERSRPANGAFAGGLYSAGGYNTVDTLNYRPEITNGLLGAQRSRPANGAFVAGGYNPTASMAAPTMPMFNGAAAANPYFASPTAGMDYAGAQGMMHNQGAQQMHAPAYYALTGAAPQMPAAYNPIMAQQQQQMQQMQQMQMNMNMNMGLGMDGVPLDNKQRAAIDRWRMGVA